MAHRGSGIWNLFKKFLAVGFLPTLGAMHFLDFQISRKKYSEKLSWAWNSNFFKVFQNIFFFRDLEIWKANHTFWKKATFSSFQNQWCSAQPSLLPKTFYDQIFNRIGTGIKVIPVTCPSDFGCRLILWPEKLSNTFHKHWCHRLCTF